MKKEGVECYLVKTGKSWRKDGGNKRVEIILDVDFFQIYYHFLDNKKSFWAFHFIFVSINSFLQP